MARKGKRYGSKASCYQVIVRGARPEYYPNGTFKGYMRELAPVFGTVSNEYTFEGPEGTRTSADIRGHFLDTGAAQDEFGWTDEERLLVEERIDQICKREPELVWTLEDARAELPWPTYEEVHHKQVPVLAVQLGLAEEALAYEKQRSSPRPEIVARLEEHLADVAREQEAEQALTVA